MSTTDCNAIRPLLALYVESETDSTQSSLVEEHIASCAACRSTVEALRAEAVAVTDALRAAPPHRSISRKVLAQLSLAKTESPAYRWMFPGLSRVAAALLVFFMANVVEVLWFSGRMSTVMDALGNVGREDVFALVISSLFRTFC